MDGVEFAHDAIQPVSSGSRCDILHRGHRDRSGFHSPAALATPHPDPHRQRGSIYECQLVANAPQWVFQAPDASLFDASGAKVGVHGAGPSWRYFDRSTVKGEVVAKNAAPEPTAISWLLLKAVNDDDSGVLAKVEFIRRSDTHGGIAPSTGCDTQHLTITTRIPYTATYTFYSAKP